MENFLPVNRHDMEQNGLAQLDFIMVTGDAYVDHPSFAHALISRWLVAHGYRVGIIAQPDWKSGDALRALGKPRLGFLVSAGNMDSMVNLFTVNKKRRSKDMYSPGGRAGRRPARSTQVYTKKIREAYGDVPVIIGGIEASLRRFAHYDYWDNKIMPSVLISSGADLLVYGMGEYAVLQIAEALDGGLPVGDITYVAGTVYRACTLERVYDYEEIPDENHITGDKRRYMDAFMKQMGARDQVLVQKHKSGYVVQNPAAEPLSQADFDLLYALPFTRREHFSYKEPVPALEEVRYSITATRGCVGACSFCALAYHQGKNVVSRSEDSIVQEARVLIEDAAFKGMIHDVGGPTANLYGARCARPNGICGSRRCLVPKPCGYFREDQKSYVNLLRRLRALPGVKKVFIRSGIRHDVALLDKSGAFIRELAKHHVSGQLKLAPEHVCGDVLSVMGKPDIREYERFCDIFNKESGRRGKEQYVLPYFMSSHPGCDMKDAVCLAEYLRDAGFTPEQAQDFYPTPGTLSTCMYYTGLDPFTKKRVYVEKDPQKKAMQRALIAYKSPANRPAVLKALRMAGRPDLIGKGKKSLV